MITAAASRVEAFAAFGADDFAFEFTSRLRRLRPVTGVTLSRRGSCLNERSLQRSVRRAHGVSEPRLGFILRPTHARPPRAREAHRVSRERLQKLFSSPRPPAFIQSRAPLDPLEGLLAPVGLLALATGARGASSSSAANGFDDMTHERPRRRDVSKINLPLEPRSPRATPDVERRARDRRRRGPALERPLLLSGKAVLSARPFTTRCESPMRVWTRARPARSAPFSHFHFFSLRVLPRAVRSSPALSSARTRARVRIESSLSSSPTSPTTEAFDRNLRIDRASSTL